MRAEAVPRWSPGEIRELRAKHGDVRVLDAPLVLKGFDREVVNAWSARD